MPIDGAFQCDVRKNLIQRSDKTFVGLDLSMTSTGMCFLTGDGMVDTFNICTSKKQGDHARRISFIRNTIWDKQNLLSRVERRPSLVAIEGYAMGIQGGMTFTIGELGGVVKESYREAEIDILIVPPSNLKQFVSAGRSKEQVMAAVSEQYDITFPTHDENDAFVLAIMAMSWHLKNVEGRYIPDQHAAALENCQYVKFTRSRKSLKSS